MPLKSIGIVGCGAIGQALLKAVGTGSLAVLIAGVTSRTEKSAREFLSNFENPPPYLPLRELIAASDLIIEAAGGSVVQSLAEEVFAAGKDLMVISAGALLDHPEIIEKSRQTGCRLYVPSGAIAGLDGIKSACAGQITQPMADAVGVDGIHDGVDGGSRTGVERLGDERRRAGDRLGRCELPLLIAG